MVISKNSRTKRPLARLIRPGVLAGVFLLTLLLLVPTAFGAGGEIRVLSDEREVRFPQDVVFNLEVEAESDIVEVALYYRLHPSGIWTYTYVDFTPSPRVESSFGLSVSGVHYVPPGSELQYYYAIRDSRGNVLKTKPETFVYVDGRFQWRTTKAGSLTIYWHDLSEARVEEVAAKVERSLSDVSEGLGVSSDVPMRGVIYNSRSEAREAFPYQSRTTTEQGLFQGFAYTERGIFVGIGLEPNLLVHESAHILLDSAAGSPGARLPAWVNEGFASHVEPGAGGYKDGFSRGANAGLMPLRQMYSIPGRPEEIRYFYRKAQSVVGYLLETHGGETFRTFIRLLDQGNGHDSALRTAYGFGLDGLDERWGSALGEAEPDGDGGSFSFPLTGLDSLLIALLAMVVVALMVGNFALRRIRKRAVEEEGDGLTEEEWDGRP